MTKIFVWMVWLVGGAGAGLYFDTFLFPGARTNILFHVGCFIIGMVLGAFVITVSKNTGRTLAKYGRKGELRRMDTNVLVKQGAYKYMRHPMHFGLLFSPLSIAFLIGSPSFLFLIAPAEIIVILLMIKFIEEPELIKQFGEKYIEYKNQLPWFCVKCSCLRELLRNPSEK